MEEAERLAGRVQKVPRPELFQMHLKWPSNIKKNRQRRSQTAQIK